MARETKGHCECFICKGRAEVRENSKTKLYLFCPGSCGLVQATGAGAQAHLRAAMRPLEPAADPAPEPTPPAPEPEPAPVPAPPAKKPGIFDRPLF